MGFLERVRGHSGLEFLGYLTDWTFDKDLATIGPCVIVSPRGVDNVGQNSQALLNWISMSTVALKAPADVPVLNVISTVDPMG